MGSYRKNVVEVFNDGWRMVLLDGGADCSYRYEWRLKLECGHLVETTSQLVRNRVPVSAPAWVDCPSCAADAQRPVPATDDKWDYDRVLNKIRDDIRDEALAPKPEPKEYSIQVLGEHAPAKVVARTLREALVEWAKTPRGREVRPERSEEAFLDMEVVHEGKSEKIRACFWLDRFGDVDAAVEVSAP